MARNKKKIVRVTTVPSSLVAFCTGQLKELSETYEVVAISSPGKDLKKIHDTDGVRTIAVSMERHISFFKDLKSLTQLIKVFRKEKPFMVHSMTPKAGLLSMIAAWVCRVPRRVHTFTGLIWPTETGLKKKILMFTDWITCQCATNIISEGKGVMDDLHNHISKKPMRVLGYGNVRGVDMNYWKATPELIERSSAISNKNFFTFIFVGRIVGDKGINELVEAFQSLLKNGYKARLLLVGDYENNLDPISELTHNRINSTSEIITTGPKFGDDLKAHYLASDCFVFPSYREGFPNTVLEAGALNLPSIVTDINGSREIIFNNKNGIIIPSKNVDALYNAMKQMIENEVVRKSMSENARQMIESRFEQSFVRKCLFDFYNDLM